MLQRILGLCLLVLLSSCAGARPRVVVISIDGLRPEFYLSRDWDTPQLHRLAQEGLHARQMLSVFPSVTYVNHTSLATGVRPARHGIMANTLFDRQLGPQPGWNFESERILAPTLWQRARDRGLTSAAFSWPVTVGAELDWNIPEIFHVDGVDEGTTEEIIRRHSTPGLMDEIARRFPRRFPVTFAEWDDWLPDAFGLVWQEKGPDLCLVHILNADWTQHRFDPNGAESHKALAEIDRVVGRIVDKVDPQETTVLIVGDHGFVPVQRALHLNRLFLDKGWIVMEKGKIRSARVIAQSNGGSAAVYCNDPRLEGEVIATLKAHAAGVYRILDGRQLSEWGAFPGALCGVAAYPGLAMRNEVQRAWVETLPATQGQHGHLPQDVPTGLIAWGRGVQGQRDLGRIRLLQVAPTVCKLLGLSREGLEAEPLPLSASSIRAERWDR